MASSSANYLSAMKNESRCVYCNIPTAILRPGWQLSGGGPALLCDRCAEKSSSAYEEGRFCNTFHLVTDGWRDCCTCGKLVHCGCIMSVHTYDLLDSGDGIICNKCLGDNIVVGSHSSGFAIKNSPPRTRMDQRELMGVGPSVNSDQMITERTPGAPSVKNTISSQTQEQPSADSSIGDNQHSGSSKLQEKLQSDASPNYQSICQYTPQKSKEELQQIQEEYPQIFNPCVTKILIITNGEEIANSVVVTLFEKTLTFSDADMKNGRMVIPKNCAKEFLPELSGPEKFPIRIQDTTGRDWQFYFRIWNNHNSVMYILEGLKDYLVCNQCQAGDKVTFYRIDPEGKLVVGLTKQAEPVISVRKKHKRACKKKEKKKTTRSSN